MESSDDPSDDALRRNLPWYDYRRYIQVNFDAPVVRKVRDPDLTYSECIMGTTSNAFCIAATIISVPWSIKRNSYYPFVLMAFMGSCTDYFVGILECRDMTPKDSKYNQMLDAAEKRQMLQRAAQSNDSMPRHQSK